MLQIEIKEALFKQCELFVNKRAETVHEIISSNQKALQSETKSSAGDKHETGRAMLQLEMEKASQQLEGVAIMNQILSKIDSTDTTSEAAHLGSIIITDKTTYFLSISAGQLIVDHKNYFAISVSSPIGKLLLGKKQKEEVFFNGTQIKINQIL
ncbi:MULTISPECIES: GreA/GreB family elongation factor [unclassified Polaribacter]|uniref:GreA/GreB family elongation factor n=1 Tax=unclassified Polaribacter TaxID=196858 RepID=UPI0011BE4CA9|nr:MULTISPECIES: GreA/GreB family elongation factor [unclassified Polaribacter]TXD52819.1 GreA/GreB family elongation factor [Polaribacter sp. IC063]TXD61696.1 GreA/GreB family elongation factor [Polaribacter sp. IC066]